MSATTIKYTCYFYRLYSQLFENRQGVIDDFDCIFRIPWSLHILIIDKFKKEPHKALFFVKKTIENNWGYAVLLNFIGSDLYERQGAAYAARSARQVSRSAASCAERASSESKLRIARRCRRKRIDRSRP